MEENKEFLLVLDKTISDGNRKYTVYYGYRQMPTAEGFEDIKTPRTKDGEQKMVSLQMKVMLSEELISRITKEGLEFPIRMELDTNHKLKDGRDSFFVTVDKDANKKVRKDKYGKRHLVCVIREPISMTPVERKTYSLADLDDFE